MHGNGNIGTVALGEIKIECSNCHGTPKKYPWELGIGYGDELLDPSKITTELKKMLFNKRGLSKESLAQTSAYTKVYEPKDGYLLSAR